MGTQFVYKDPVERHEDDFVLHLFVIVSTDPHWSWLRLEIAVNPDGQISCEHSDWHGLAVYRYTPNNTSWTLTFNPRAQPDRMQTFVFNRIEDTHSFINMDSERRYNGVLIPKIVDWDRMWTE